VHEHVGARDEPASGGRVAHVPAQLVDGALEPLVVERSQVERAHAHAVREQTPREVQAEKARAA
jgi:hypothetical protein